MAIVTDVNGFERHSEEKNANKRIHLLSLDSENINTHNNVYKRQINPGLTQIGQSIESQVILLHHVLSTNKKHVLFY